MFINWSRAERAFQQEQDDQEIAKGNNGNVPILPGDRRQRSNAARCSGDAHILMHL
jgi:hypothetical protein